VLIAWSLILGTGGFLFFGALSDRIGRKPVILGGCLIAAITYFPLFQPSLLPPTHLRECALS
jgi:MFS family permease